ncbi:ribosome assembly RNA-binding protein YhbY [Methanocaldococcus indicus]|uniref:ribosome assembly RNA-binding protein YhbY n=1 Tax=Methanocaldococcus indicus TaxID=213231 RepID=UPI003C6D0491
MVRLTGKMKKVLRAKAHNLEPVVWIGKEGSSKVIKEVDRQLSAKGLIKVKIRKTALMYEDKKDIAEKLAKETDSEVVSLVGHVITLFRPREGWKKYLSKKPKTIKKDEKIVKLFEKFKKEIEKKKE